MKRLSRQDIDDLQRQIPSRDVVAEKQGKRVYHGRIEEIEETMLPWLRQRRRSRRPQT